jgi:hypothetical protein
MEFTAYLCKCHGVHEGIKEAAARPPMTESDVPAKHTHTHTHTHTHIHSALTLNVGSYLNIAAFFLRLKALESLRVCSTYFSRFYPQVWARGDWTETNSDVLPVLVSLIVLSYNIFISAK